MWRPYGHCHAWPEAERRQRRPGQNPETTKNSTKARCDIVSLRNSPLTMNDMGRSPSPEFSPLEFGEDLAPMPEYKPAGTTAVDFSGLLGEPLKLHEDLASGCGGQLWPAGLVLAKHMLRYHQDRLQHARMSVTFPAFQRFSMI